MTTNSDSKKEGKGSEFNFGSCMQMMKQFCAGKDGKSDMGQCCSKMAKYFEKMKKESNA